MVEIDTIIFPKTFISNPGSNSSVREDFFSRWVNGGVPLVCLPHCAGCSDGLLGAVVGGLFFEIGGCSTSCGVQVA